MKNPRINIVYIFLIIISATIAVRLFFIQVLQGDFYRALSQGLHSPFTESVGNRGKVFLKNGEPLAINLDWPLAFAHPEKVKNPEDTAQVLAEILNLDEGFVLEKLTQKVSYVIIKKKLNQEEAGSLGVHDLEGVFISKEKGRYYPQESLASQVIGFLGAGGKGQYGIEQFYDEALRGEEGIMEEKEGSGLVLTLEYDVQFEAEKLLKKTKDNLKIEGGQIIVMDPGSGAVLAMADLSNFDPN